MSLTVNSINVIDFEHKRSRLIEFKSGINVVTSEQTSMGKSSILRAIYHSLGANSAYDDKFNSIDKVFEITFSSDGIRYRIIRFKNSYIVYKEQTIVLTVKSDYKKLAKFFESEFSESIYLTDKSGDFDIAPTTYLYIPYFLDQDNSWKKEMIPFLNTAQFNDDQVKNLYYYHLGALDTKFYDLNRQLSKSNGDIKSIEEGIKKNQNELLKLKKEYSVETTPVNEESAKTNLELMKQELSNVLSNSNESQKKIYNIENEIASLNIQITTIDKLLKEQNKALIKINSDKEQHIRYCENCGAPINLDQFDDYQIRYNTEFLTEKKKSLEYHKNTHLEEVKKLKENHLVNVKEVEKVTSKFNADSKLFEKYVRAKAVNIIMLELENKLEGLYKILSTTNLNNENIKNALKYYESTKRNINSDFRDFYYNELTNLQVVSIDKESIKNFKKFILSGSQYVRSTLAFFITFLKLKQKYNPDKYNFPLVVDSPFEGDQDSQNRNDIVRSLMSLSNFDQMIIGMRDAKEYFSQYKISVNIIELENNKGQVLTENDYEMHKNHNHAIVALIINT